ncbi:MAG TPA: PIN domain-containing protein [Solirubrobacteraceae bacterium]
MATATYLVDNSVLARMAKPSVAIRMEPMIVTGTVAACSVTDLETLFSARSGEEHHARRADLELRFVHVPVDQPMLNRAVEVQGLLAERGQHRGANLPDLMVAAAAERAELAVLHYDADFDLIATVTGQEMEWVVPRGSVD